MKKKSEPQENLVKLFGSVSRARILGFHYAFSGRSFYQREIVFETGLALGAVQRELDNLGALGIVKTERTRSRVCCEINRGSPLFKLLGEICSGFQGVIFQDSLESNRKEEPCRQIVGTGMSENKQMRKTKLPGGIFSLTFRRASCQFMSTTVERSE